MVSLGFKNIELSGGTEYYKGFEYDLLDLKEKYDLKYMCHNYFPPPKEHFVLNLASLNDDVYRKTLTHLTNVIKLSKKLGAKKFGFHAGFFIDIKVNEIGKKITKNNLFDINKSIKRFCDGFNELKKIAGNVELYIENNVFSTTNYKTYQDNNPFMLTNSADYKKLKDKIDFNLLLDVAHLKVSANTLGLDFENELKYMISQSNYLHISDNDSLHDLNNKLNIDSSLASMLKKYNLKNKTFTLEVYDSIDNIKKTYLNLKDIINA